MAENQTTPNTDQKQTIGISFCMLMNEYPLYDRRIARGSDPADLCVILVGSGPRLKKLLDMALTGGQLLNTDLQVIVLTDQVASDHARLLTDAPLLPRFIRIEGHGEPASPQWELGTLTYESGPYTAQTMASVFSKYPQCSYVLLCTDSDAQNKALANHCIDGKKRVVAYAEGDSLQVVAPKETHFSEGDAEAHLDEIRPISFNIHYAYEKGNDPHISFAEIEHSYHNQYKKEANMECALHVHNKLRCCGIDVRKMGTKAAASAFADLLSGERGEKWLSELAQMEHRRWCLSKVLGGFLQQTDESMLYSAEGVTTHSSDPKWHTVLVPYRTDPQYRSLEQEDWLREDPDNIEGLDELDRQTLWIHQACRKIALDKDGICREKAAKFLEMAEACFVDDKELSADAQKLSHALEQMNLGVRSAVFLFKRCRKSLKDTLILKNDTASGEMLSILHELDVHSGALREYVSQKDYKEQNLTQIRQIPFALSGWRNVTLVKLMGETEHDCVSSAWQLEPTQVIFVDLAHSFEELAQIRSRAKRIDRFLYNDCNHIRTSYRIIIAKGEQKIGGSDFFSGWEANIYRDYPEFFDGWECTIHPVDNGNPFSVRPVFVEIMEQYHPDYIDLTGGKPELISVASGYAENSRTGAFFIRDNRFRDFYGASGLANVALDKGVTVKELFDQANAVRIKSDDEQMSGRIFQAYQPLWKIAHDYADHWYGFCIRFFAPAYRDAMADETNRSRDKLDIPKQYIKDRLAGLPETERQEYRKILTALVRKKLVSASGSCYTVCSHEVLAALRNSGKVLEYYIYCTAKTRCNFQDVAMSWMFSHSDDTNAAKNELDVICTAKNTSLFISAKNVTMHTIKTGNFLNYVCYEVSVLANRFGINAKTVLAAPNVPQFDSGRRSDKVLHAMSRGVYLLGDACFTSGRLGEVLDNIAQGKENWCECLLEKVPAGV